MTTIRTIRRTFYLLPLISVTKVINPLTKEAKLMFQSNWNYYYSFKIGWLFWSFEF